MQEFKGVDKESGNNWLQNEHEGARGAAVLYYSTHNYSTPMRLRGMQFKAPSHARSTAVWQLKAHSAAVSSSAVLPSQQRR